MLTKSKRHSQDTPYEESPLQMRIRHWKRLVIVQQVDAQTACILVPVDKQRFVEKVFIKPDLTCNVRLSNPEQFAEKH